MSLANLFQQRDAHDSEKVLRRILCEDEIWYWDPTSNVVDKKRIKKDKKERKEIIKRGKDQDMRENGHAEPNASRRALATSDDVCWRKAEINRTTSKRDETITMGNSTEALETTEIKPIEKSKSKLKTHPLIQHSISFTNMFRRKSSSSSSAPSASSEESDSEEDSSSHTIPRGISRFRLKSLRNITKPSSTSSSSTTTASSSSTTTSLLDSTLSGSTCSSTTSSATNSPMTSPRSPTIITRSPSNTTASPVVSPRAGPTTARMRLNMGLRKHSLSGPISPNSPNDQSTSPASSPNDQTISPTCSPRLACNELIIDEIASPNLRAPCPPPLALEPITTNDDELGLQSIDELTDDSGNESIGSFWNRERKIPPTPYFDLIMESFDECL